MPTEKYSQNIIVQNYSRIIKEYFFMLSHSKIINSLPNPNQIVFIGVNALNKVFEYILLKTKNTNHAYFYSHKCCCYYLEYMEQMYSNDLIQTMNIMDAVMFVYKKTLFYAFSGAGGSDQSNDSDTETCSNLLNIMSCNNNDIVLKDVEICEVVNTCKHIVKVLLFWDNYNITTENRMKLCDECIDSYLKHLDISNDICSCLEIIQQKINMDFLKYNDLLHEFISRFNKSRKSKSFREDDLRDNFYLKIYAETDVFYEKVNEGHMKDFVKWLLV